MGDFSAYLVTHDPVRAREMRALLGQLGFGAVSVVSHTADLRDALGNTRPAAVLVDVERLDHGQAGADITWLRGRIGGRVVGLLPTPVDDAGLRLARMHTLDACLVRPVHVDQLRGTLELLAPGSCDSAPVSYDGAATARSGTHAIDHARIAEAAEAERRLAELSRREREVFGHLVLGHRAEEVAKILHISRHTVRQHAKSVFRKLGVHSQIELMRRFGAQQQSVIPPAGPVGQVG